MEKSTTVYVGLVGTSMYLLARHFPNVVSARVTRKLPVVLAASACAATCTAMLRRTTARSGQMPRTTLRYSAIESLLGRIARADSFQDHGLPEPRGREARKRGPIVAPATTALRSPEASCRVQPELKEVAR